MEVFSTIYSKIEYVIDQTNHNCIIINFETVEKYRNMGHGINLLTKFINYMKLLGISTILLDDCSDNFNSQNNIYIKCGFLYIIEGFPEMILSL